MASDGDFDNRSMRECFAEIKGMDAEKRTVTGYASTGTIDRYGEIVQPTAFARDLKRFLAERHLFAANHRYVNDAGEPLIIGKITDGEIDDKGLKITAQFDDDPISEQWWRKYQKGIVRSFSIGFIPRKWEDRMIQQDGDVPERRVRVYTDVELLEISAVPIPANRESMVTASFDETTLAKLLADVAEIKKTINDFQAYHREAAEQVLVLLAERDDCPAPDDAAGGHGRKAPAGVSMAEWRKSLGLDT